MLRQRLLQRHLHARQRLLSDQHAGRRPAATGIRLRQRCLLPATERLFPGSVCRPLAHPNQNADQYADKDSDQHAHADTHAHEHPDEHPNSNSHPDSDQYPNVDFDVHEHRNSDANEHADIDTNRNEHADKHTHQLADAHAIGDADKHPDGEQWMSVQSAIVRDDLLSARHELPDCRVLRWHLHLLARVRLLPERR